MSEQFIDIMVSSQTDSLKWQTYHINDLVLLRYYEAFQILFIQFGATEFHAVKLLKGNISLSSD